MSTQWTEADLQRYVNEKRQESLTLDYKAGVALHDKNKRTDDVTKDVSAMANSAGGIIIYGISEDKSKTIPIPDKISPVDASQISKETLDHLINNIQPRINCVIVHPVPLSSAPNDIAYVVEIPQSTTVHQATDKKYYKRFNFKSEAMYDYEVRDVMGRGQYPDLQLQFEIRPKYTSNQAGSANNYFVLIANVSNNGGVFAQYVETTINIPKIILGGGVVIGEHLFTADDGVTYRRFKRNNFKSDSEQYGVLLPQSSREWFETQLSKNFYSLLQNADLRLTWRVFADNAPPNEGTEAIRRMPIIGIH